MGTLQSNSFLLLFFTLASLIPTLTANVGDWEWENTIAAQNSSETRRELRGRRYRGPCTAFNIIDRCWRCDRNWAANRQRLADCAQGFGKDAIGGKFGKIYVVTDSSDPDVMNPRPGTLRHAVIQKEPLWIIFARDMTIRLQQELIIQSHKTLDGRGANVHIAYGAGITLQYVQNIIIHNLRIHNIAAASGGLIRDSVDHFGFRSKSDGDGIQVDGSRNIWLDHLSMTRAYDGLIDAVAGATGITISNCHFTDHDKVLLFGGQENDLRDKQMRITVVYNHFGKRLTQRMPRCRTGFFHIVNNDYTNWVKYAIGGSSHPTVISQGNRFVAQKNVPIGSEYVKIVTHRDLATEAEWRTWTWQSDGDLFVNGAYFVPSGDPNGAKKFAALELIKPLPATMVKDLTKFAGYLRCRVGFPC